MGRHSSSRTEIQFRPSSVSLIPEIICLRSTLPISCRRLSHWACALHADTTTKHTHSLCHQISHNTNLNLLQRSSTTNVYALTASWAWRHIILLQQLTLMDVTNAFEVINSIRLAWSGNRINPQQARQSARFFAQGCPPLASYMRRLEEVQLSGPASSVYRRLPQPHRPLQCALHLNKSVLVGTCAVLTLKQQVSKHR